METETKIILKDELVTKEPVKTTKKSPITKEPVKATAVKPKSARDAQYEKDHEMVKGRFTFHEVPGGTLSFPFIKYKGDSPRPYTLRDGQVCEVPYMVAKHLNVKGRYPIHQYTLDEEGKRSMKVGQWIARFSFQPLGFFDDYEVQPKPNLISVESV